jgi:hypothetical protein
LNSPKHSQARTTVDEHGNESEQQKFGATPKSVHVAILATPIEKSERR